MKKTINLILLTVLFATPLLAADFFVAPTGDDGAAGTLSAPFKTLSKAKSAVRTALHSGSGPINIYVRAGIYYMDSTLILTPEDGGTAARPVSYSAYQGEKVVLSGGKKITPTWTPYSGDIMVADIGSDYDFDMLFLGDDEMLTMARWPNFDADKILQGYGNLSEYKARASHWSNPIGGYMRALHNGHWGGNSFKIVGSSAYGDKDPGSGITPDFTQDDVIFEETDAPGESSNKGMEWAGDNNRGSKIDPDYMMAENIFEELDAPGEWYYDKRAGKLYLYPPDGFSLKGNYVVGATLEELIKVMGTDAKKVSYLTFSGFTFTHTHRTLFAREYEPMKSGAAGSPKSTQGSDWSIARAGALYIEMAENVTVKNCNFKKIGGNALFMSRYNRNHWVANCDFTDLGASGVVVFGDPSAQRVLPDVTPGPANDNYPRNITITYCYMFNNGMFEKQTSAVCIQTAEFVTVSHTTAHHGPRAGFNIGSGSFGGHIFEYNELFDQMRETKDHGPFNAWMRDRWMSHMRDYENSWKLARLDCIHTIIVRNNRMSHPAGVANHGMDWDNGSGNFNVYNNLLINAPIKIQRGFYQTVTNNIIINESPTIHIWRKYKEMNKFYFRNIVQNFEPYWSTSSHIVDPDKAFLDFNVFWNNGEPLAGKWPSLQNIWKKYHWDEHSVTADPLFVNPAEGDYRVKDGSPALTLGFKNFDMNKFGKPGYPTFENYPTSVLDIPDF